MRLLVDLSAVTGGGGAEQAIGLLDSLTGGRACSRHYVEYAIRTGTRVEAHAKSLGLQYHPVGNSLLARVHFSLFGAARITKASGIDAVYVGFGVGVRIPSHLPQIISVAYPVICYPDSPYWTYLPRPDWLRIRVKTLLRSRLLRRHAHMVLAESQLMAQRLATYAGMDDRRIRILPPLMGATAKVAADEGGGRQPKKANSSKTIIIFPSGDDFHKNLWRLPSCAVRLAELGISNVLFQLTIQETQFIELCDRMGASYSPAVEGRYFAFLGPLFGDALAKALHEADAVGNLSDLESVSNNFIEAVAVRKPMLLGERDFALASVGVPFVLCDPHDAESVVRAIIALQGGRLRTPSSSCSPAVEAFNRTSLLLDFAEEALCCSRRS